MAFNRGPKIVTQGLVLAFDAASKNSYVSGSTTWTDLSGNNNTGSLVNGVTYTDSYNGGLSFNAANSNYIILPAVINTNANFTLMFTSSHPSDTGTLFSGAPGTTTGNLQIRTYASSVSLVKNTIAELGNFGANSGTPHNKPAVYAIGLNKAATTSYCYINGVFISTLALNQTFTTIAPALGASTNGEYYTGTIHNFSYYNRLLSAEEIAQNYNATKSRFNL
jgi:hypothetical protein